MSIRFISPNVHAILDYVAAFALIVFPLILNLGSESVLAMWLSIGGGAALVIYSLLTDYALDGRKLIPYKYHLVIDLTAAAVFIVAPILFEWNLLTTAYYFVMGAGVLVVVGFSDKQKIAEELRIGKLSH